jgi:MFS family permease
MAEAALHAPPPGGGKGDAPARHTYSVLMPSIVTFVCGMSCFQFGFHLGLSSPIEVDVRAQAGLSPNQSNLMWSLLSIGAMVGGLLGPAASARWGRTRPVALCALLFVPAAVLSTSVVSMWALSLGRLIAGFAVGFTTGIVPLYVAEICPSPLRGLLGALLQSFIAFGLVSVSALGVPTAYDHFWWKTLYLLSIVPAAVRVFHSAPVGRVRASSLSSPLSVSVCCADIGAVGVFS